MSRLTFHFHSHLNIVSSLASSDVGPDLSKIDAAGEVDLAVAAPNDDPKVGVCSSETFSNVPISPAIMGKSNKFDFTNRSSCGTKLGNSMASLLIKEAEKLQKQADKAEKTSRKASIASISSDAKDSIHYIDLQAPNKELGDDGLCALADGLQTALRGGSSMGSISSLALEDLNLSGNSITTISLARLAPIVKVAKHDLKTLNLANNNIRVSNAVEAEQWQNFLISFKECFKLRRLDLSKNNLGSWAMEILAKVHIAELPINPIPAGGEISVLSLLSEQHDEEALSASTSFKGDLPWRSLSDGLFLRRKCGLRSIPFITLHETNLTDSGALWLSYVLEDHHYPSHLINELNATTATTTIKTYQQGVSDGGLDWGHNNETLAKDGQNLLQRTEAARQYLLDDQQSVIAASIIEDSLKSPTETRKSYDRRDSRASVGNRKASVRSIHSTDGSVQSDLESARKRMQRHIIEQEHASGAELWHSALKIVNLSRMILWISPPIRKLYTGEALFATPTNCFSMSDTEDCVYTHVRDDQSKMGSYVSTLLATNGACDREFAITESTNTPASPKRFFKPHRKGGFSEGTDLPAVSEKLNALIIQNADRANYISYQQYRMEETIYRSQESPSHLPQYLVELILSFAMSKRELSILSEKQRAGAIAWGQSRGSLQTVGDWRKKDEASQVWLLLDRIHCLGYGH